MAESRLLVPPLILAMGALLILCLRPWLGRAGRRFLVLITSVAAFGATLWVAMGLPAVWVISTWAGLGAYHQIRLAASDETGALMLLTTLVVLALSLGSLDEEEPAKGADGYETRPLLVAAALHVVLLADGFLTLLYAFVLLDLAVLYALGAARRERWPLVAIILGGTSNTLLLAAALWTWHAHASISITVAGVEPVVTRILAVAFALRLGLFPLHFWVSAAARLPQRLVGLVVLATLGAGGVWLSRGGTLWGADFIPALVALPAAGTLAVVGLLAWLRSDATTRLTALASWYGTWVVWAVAYGRADLALGVVAGGVLSLVALALYGGMGRFRALTALPAIPAAAAAVGVPGSILFMAGAWLLGQSLYRGEPLIALLAVLGVVGATAATLELLTLAREGEDQRSRWTGLLILGLAAWPLLGRLAAVWPLSEPVSVGRFDADLPFVVGFGPLCLGWAGGVLLWRLRPVFARAQPILGVAGGVVGLGWAWNIAARFVAFVTGSVRGLMRLLEGENYGWLLLFVLLGLFFLTRG